MSRSLAAWCAVLLLAATARAEAPRWSVLWDVHIVPTEGVAHVVMTLGDHGGVVELFDFQLDPQRLSGFEGDGQIDNAGNRLRWTGVAVPGHADDAGRVLTRDGLARVRMPKGFLDALRPLLAAGTTLVLTDAPILPQSTGAALTVVTNQPPEG